MKAWTVDSFEGHYPIGTAAVIVAENISTAITILEDKLRQEGLQQQIKPDQLVPLSSGTSCVRILNDGNY